MTCSRPGSPSFSRRLTIIDQDGQRFVEVSGLQTGAIVAFHCPVEHLGGKLNGLFFPGNSSRTPAMIFAKVDDPSSVSLCRRESRRGSRFWLGYKIGGVGFQEAQKGQVIFVVPYSDIAFVTLTVALRRDIAQDSLKKSVAGVGTDIEGGNADGLAEENLSSFAFDGGLVGNVLMVDFSFEDVAVGQGGDQILHIHRLGHIFLQAVEERIAASLEPGIARGGENPLPIGQVHGHPRVKDAHFSQVFFQPFMVAGHAVQARTGLGGEQGDQIIDEAKIGDQIPLQVQASWPGS